jgi:RHS repeat-associated protein
MTFLLTRTLICLVSTLFLAIAAIAQTSITDGKTPTGLTPGAPAGSYPLGDFDNINLFNGNLNFRIPLLKIGGRGSAGYTITLPIEQKWIIKKGVFNPFTGTFPMTPNPNWWQGIKPGYGPGVLHGRRTGYGPYPGQNYCGQTPPEVFEQTLTRLTFTTADGTEYEFRDQLTNGTPGQVSSVPCAEPGTARGKVFVSNDGSAATFISDTAIYDHKGQNITLTNRLFYPSGYLMLRDGTRYRIDSGRVSWIRDRNGNKVKVESGIITDSINRTVTISMDDGVRNYDEISYSGFPGYAGGAGRTIRVWYDMLQNRLRSGYSPQTFYQLFPLNSASTSSTYNAKKVSKVQLPDGRFYQFYYNPYGELARVELPTGGVFEYDWDGITDGQSEVLFRYVIERRVYSDSTTCESRTKYFRNGEVKIYDGPGTHLIGYTKHYFNGDAFESMIEDPARPSAINFSPWEEGREVKTELFDIVAGSPVLKKTVEHTWQQPTVSSTWPITSGQGETSLEAMPNNPQITETKTTLADTNQVAKQIFKYDRYGNRTDVSEYDFGLVLIRRSHTDFLTTHSSGADYACNPTTTCGSNASIDNIVHLRSLPTQQQVFDSSDIERSRQTFEYDNYTATTSHAALVPRSNVSGLCAVVTTATPCDNSNPAAFTKRGNVTAASQFVLGTAVVVNTYSQYDVVGNVVKTINPRGYETTIEYSDVYGAPDGNARLPSAPLNLAQVNEVSYAFPTIITNAKLHKVYSQFDYNTGQAVDVENANGLVSSFYFNDLLDRPTQTRRAVGTTLQTQTTATYNDAARSITISSDRDANNDNILVSKSIYDPLGRTVETQQYEGGTQYIAIKKIPFEVVQDGSNWRVVSRTSNPYRPTQEQASWTTSMSDSLGRTIKVTTPDSASVTSAYSGNSVTVTDQTGKVRKSVTDAAGRLKEVWEDPGSSPHLNYLTTYEYDTLDNLKKVIQDNNPLSPVQPPRIFVYDSLQRLTSASNPESGTINYQYDNAGNLIQKTDARGVVSTFVYDELNRNTSVTYTNDPAGTLPMTRVYDTATKGKGFLHYSQTTGTGGSLSTTDAYDELGRPTNLRQQFYVSGAWSSSYTTSRTYNLAGGVTLQTYPSGRTVTYNYDAAGRLADKDAQNLAFSGNLGDNTTRTYSAGILYSPFGGIVKEQFGTNTALYHKSFYNIRGQLFDTRLSSVNDTWDWNRGRLIFYYSSNHQWGGSGTDNNGNVLFAETWIPPLNATLDQTETVSEQSYDYDSLNRLKSVTEQRIIASNGWVWQPQFKQSYDYDRYGNRTIKPGAADTWGTGINSKQFAVNAVTNRLGVPAGQSGTMSYDNNGNLITDSYSGAGARVYDAENRMTKAWGGNNQWQEYTYDADHHRTRRKIDGVETWQVYGFGGELLAEYAANGAAVTPQKEYGYRNGQLLITAEAASAPAAAPSGPNFAAASNGATATASSTYTGVTASNTNNGDHVGTASWWADNTSNTYPDTLQVEFSGTKTISEIDVYGLQQNHGSPVEPTLTMTSSYALTNFEVQYWTNNTWATVPGGSVTGNDKVWRRFTFAPLMTSKIRVYVTSVAGDNRSQIVELEAYGPLNVAAASNGATATASSTYPTVTPGNTNNGDHVGSASWWADDTSNTYPDTLQVEFSGSKTIGEIDVYGLQQNYGSPVEPTPTMTSSYALTNFEVQYWTNNAWATVPGGSVTGNDKVWRKFTFAPLTTTKIRVYVTHVAGDNRSQIVEIEAYTATAGAATVQWLVTDHLGTPRMIFDQTGTLASVKRHDYLPFGEELFAPGGGRTAAWGYSSGDNIRQQFTAKERDIETGLDYFGARYYANTQGRFASADEPLVDQWPSSPQTWNLYMYGANNPLRFKDLDGLAHWDSTGHFVGDYEGEFNEDLQAVWVKTKKGGYWDFEKGAQVVRDRLYAEMQMDLIRQRAIIRQVERKIFRQWLEDRYRPKAYGDTIILFGPITSFSRLLGPATEALQLGTARMNLLNAIQNPTLRRLVEYSYRVGARIGNGSTADAIRFEKETGILLSRTGHIQKGKEVLSSLEKLLGSNKLNSKDAEIARQLIDDLKDALK